MYAFVDVAQYQIVGTGQTIDEAKRNYRETLRNRYGRRIVREKAVWQKQKLKRRMREQQKSFWMLTMTQ